MKISPGWFVIFLLSALFLAACGTGLPPAPASTPTSSIAFPRQPQPEGERAVMEALAGGQLALADNCLRLAQTGGESYLLIWPPGYSLATEDGSFQIHDEQGQAVAQIGDTLQMGGGGVPLLAQLDKSVQAQVPPQCAGPYWVIGDMFRRISRGSPAPTTPPTKAETATPSAVPFTPEVQITFVPTRQAPAATPASDAAPVTLAALEDHRLIFTCLDGGACLPEVDLSSFDILAEPYELDAVYYWDPTSVFATFYAMNNTHVAFERMVIHLNPQTGEVRATGVPGPLNFNPYSLVTAVVTGRLVLANPYQDNLYILDRDLALQTIQFGTGITGMDRRREALVEAGGSKVLAFNRIPEEKNGGNFLEAVLVDVVSGQSIYTLQRLPELERPGPQVTPQPGKRYLLGIDGLSPDLRQITVRYWSATEPLTLWLATFAVPAGPELAATDDNWLASLTLDYSQYRNWLYSSYVPCEICGDSSHARLVDMPSLTSWIDPQEYQAVVAAGRPFTISPFGDYFLLDKGGQVGQQSFDGRTVQTWSVPADWLNRKYRLVQVRR